MAVSAAAVTQLEEDRKKREREERNEKPFIFISILLSFLRFTLSSRQYSSGLSFLGVNDKTTYSYCLKIYPRGINKKNFEVKIMLSWAFQTRVLFLTFQPGLTGSEHLLLLSPPFYLSANISSPLSLPPFPSEERTAAARNKQG